MGFHHRTFRRPSKKNQEGYVVLVLMMMIFMLIVVPFLLISWNRIGYDIQRDREDEMVHRGVQYTRAIQKFVRKNGRYPSKLEDLEDTNHIRYLRRRYKDPENKNKDFKLLHQNDPEVRALGSFGTAGGLGGSSGLGGLASQLGGANGLNKNNIAAAVAAVTGGSAAQGSLPGGVNNLNPDQNSDGTSGGDASNPSDASQAGSGTADANGLSSQQPGQIGSSISGPTIGGSIVGVVSASKPKDDNAEEKQKAHTFHEYNKKKHYNEWLFIYDQSSDKNGSALISTPYKVPTFTQNNVNGNNATSGSGSGSNSSQGNQVPSNQPSNQTPSNPPPPSSQF